MRVDFSEAGDFQGWADLREHQTLGDRLVIRHAVGGVWEVSLLLRVVQSWSLGPVTAEVIDQMAGELGDWLLSKISDMWLESAPTPLASSTDSNSSIASDAA